MDRSRVWNVVHTDDIRNTPTPPKRKGNSRMNDLRLQVSVNIEPWLVPFMDVMKEAIAKSLEAGMPIEASDPLIAAIGDVARRAIVAKAI